ncbi:endolytic transglycosylase MltG [Streptomyces sp. NPDC047315]|uniref:endolytic transglycosylase MltG n=1 Tax=Streptomyces sp. NPDC047315 TaxID=3155142 RepID=UPI0033DFF031
MTDYGRGPGSEPWHPDDPLYGDQGWHGQQAGSGHDPYGGQPQQQYPQPQHGQHGQHPEQAYGGQDPYQQQYAQQHQQQAPYGGGQQHPGHQTYGGGWDGQQPAVGYGPETYGANPADAYAGQAPGYQGQPEADYYATPDAYPPPEPPARRSAEPEAKAAPWDAEAPDEERHPFFGDGTDDDADDEGRRDGGRRDGEVTGRAARRGGGGAGGGERRGKGKKKSRNGCACLVVSLVLVTGVGGVSYFGYQFWQGQFGAAPDYAGAGSGSVVVEVPKDAGLAEIGSILKKHGVVKSSGAFVAAADSNPRAKTIQAGVYVLAKEMSGANAVKLMLDPKSSNNLIIPEGKRNSQIYADIDKRLELKLGTTQQVAKDQVNNLGLPAWAGKGGDIKDPLEGFLFPAAYPVAKGMKPEAVLKKMVGRAKEEFEKADLEKEAQRLGLKSPMEILTIASLVQAEGKYKDDFDKVARVVYNRLQPDNTQTGGRLEFDSTVNYFKGQSRLDIGSVDKVRQYPDPYNTYRIKGLPPGPIGNPGMAAFNSALKPADGDWYYFVSVDEDDTRFSETHEEHEAHRREYLEKQKAGQ